MANRIALLLSVLGVQIAGYLTLAHLRVFPLVCGGARGCDTVAASPLAHGLGVPALAAVPTAAFGLAAYVLLAGLSAWRLGRASWRVALAQWALAAAALGVSLWLTFAEAYLIRDWCLWCLGSQGVALGLFLVLSGEMLRAARRGWPAARPAPLVPHVAALALVMLVADGVAFVALRRVPAPPAAPPSVWLLPGTPVLGAADAAYTLIEFGDYACVHCQETEPRVRAAVDRHRNLRAVFYYCPVMDAPHALAARAAQAAARQGRFWPMHARLMAQAAAGTVTKSWVRITAAQVGCDGARFQRDLDGPAIRRTLDAQRDLSDAFAVDGVPAFYLLAPDGRVTPLAELDALERALPR
jgi:protein-disulfide isomerase